MLTLVEITLNMVTNCESMLNAWSYWMFFMFSAIDLCAIGKDDCHEFATCTYTGPGTYSCACNKGYLWDGKTCTGLEILNCPMLT